MGLPERLVKLRLRYSLRFLLLLLLVTALIGGWAARIRDRGTRQRQFIEAGRAISGFEGPLYDYQVEFRDDGWSFAEQFDREPPPYPPWVYDRVGPELLHKIVAVWVLYPDDDAAALLPLTELDSIRALKAEWTTWFDRDVEHLLEFRDLEYLDLQAGNMTDEGLLRLAEFPKIKVIEIELLGTNLTEAGIEALRARRPDCLINGRRGP